jgi:hypothetical protein
MHKLPFAFSFLFQLLSHPMDDQLTPPTSTSFSKATLVLVDLLTPARTLVQRLTDFVSPESAMP